MITVGDKIMPFIESSSEGISLLTHTRVVRESNDESFYLELYSKTFVARERDDESVNYN